MVDFNDELLARTYKLNSAVVADIMDELGHRYRTMAARVRPLYPTAKLVGYALTIHAEPTDELPAERESQYQLHLKAVDSVQPNDVIVVSTIEYGFWGELLSVAAKGRGAKGIVIDGYTRDALQIIEMKFPTFTTGIHPADSLGRGRVMEFGNTIQSGGVSVSRGDIILGDYDGVSIVPSKLAEEVISLAEEKLRGEDTVREELEAGHAVTDVFLKYGIL